ncbi:MAG: endonuclease/exonuclease/phosphatase family protein [Paludibacteraceae bacterium]|nr:endonuclease/exonuclease/phosphatase family protein [Paludibacteraceae bacterium]
MTINIHTGSDTSLVAIAEFINQYHPDLVALQEVDMWPNRPGAPEQRQKNISAELSLHTNMIGYFGKAWNISGKWMYGNGILSKYSVNKLETFLLPYNDKPGSEPRALSVASITINDKDICFASTHLCYKYPENRIAQLKKINSIMMHQKEKIKILCGDFNSDSSENLVFTTMKKWCDVLPENKTFPSNGKAYAKYDYIMVPKRDMVVVTNTFFVCDEKITDHCACIADIVIP